MQFSRACGQNCFALSYLTLLEAVRDCCSEASEDTLKWLAAATAAGALIIIPLCSRLTMPVRRAPTLKQG